MRRSIYKKLNRATTPVYRASAGININFSHDNTRAFIDRRNAPHSERRYLHIFHYDDRYEMRAERKQKRF